MKNKRNIVIAVVFLIVLLVLPFWSMLQGVFGFGKTKTTSEAVPPEKKISCTVAVSAAAASLQVDARKLIPEDGWLFPQTTMTVSEGASVLSALRQTGLAVETDGVPPYVVGVGGLYAGDVGELSGWMYTVNGETPMVGCEEQKVTDGDEILWSYVTTWDTAS